MNEPAIDGALGREAELAELDRALGAAERGRAQAVFVVGEAGIGKTKLVDAFSARAESRARFLWGRAWEGGGAPAYWPFIHALRPLARGRDAALSPELEGLLGPPAGGPAGSVSRPEEADQARFRLFDAVASLLAEAAAARPIVLVLDDLHAADRSSLLLLSFVARTLRDARVLIVGTYRDGELAAKETGSILAGAVREGRHLVLRGLARDAVSALVARSGVPATERAIDHLLAATEGNPLFVEETLRHAAAERVELDGPRLLLPATVAEVLRRRVARLPPATTSLLREAAVLGRDFRLDLLAEATGRGAGALDAELAPARAAGLVVAGAPGEARFSHALVREMLVRDLDPSARIEAHRAAARACEALVARGVEIGWHVLLHLATEADPDGRDVAPVELALRAAEEASRVLAFDDAATLLETALARTRSAGAPAPLELEVRLALGRALLLSGCAEEGKAVCARALERARELGDAHLLAQAALSYGVTFAFFSVDARLVELLSEALDRLGDEESPLAARVRARLAAAQQPARDPAGPVALAREAIAMARRSGEDETLLDVLHTAMAAMMDVVDPRKRRPLNEETRQLAERRGDTQKMLRAHARLVIDALELGDFAGALAHERAHAALAERRGREADRFRAAAFAAARAIREGRFDEVDALHAQARAHLGGARDVDADILFTTQRMSMLRMANRRAELLSFEPEVLRAYSAVPDAPVWRAIYAAGIRAFAGDVEGARAAFARLPEAAPLYQDISIMALEVETAALVGDRRRLETLAAVLPAWRHRFACGGMTSMFCEGPVGRWEASCGPRSGGSRRRSPLSRTRSDGSGTPSSQP